MMVMLVVNEIPLMQLKRWRLNRRWSLVFQFKMKGSLWWQNKRQEEGDESKGNEEHVVLASVTVFVSCHRNFKWRSHAWRSLYTCSFYCHLVFLIDIRLVFVSLNFFFLHRLNCILASPGFAVFLPSSQKEMMIIKLVIFVWEEATTTTTSLARLISVFSRTGIQKGLSEVFPWIHSRLFSAGWGILEKRIFMLPIKTWFSRSDRSWSWRKDWQ